MRIGRYFSIIKYTPIAMSRAERANMGCKRAITNSRGRMGAPATILARAKPPIPITIPPIVITRYS